MKIKVGEKIYFEIDGRLEIDKIKEFVTVDGEFLITPSYYSWLTLSKNDLLDESDERVKEDKALHSEKMIKLSEAREWIKHHIRDYYEADEWSNFDDEQAIKDFCKAMVY